MPPQIDFLPKSYHDRRQRRHRSLWRQGMLSIVALLVVAGVWGQKQRLKRLDQDRIQLLAQAQAMQSQTSEAAALRREIEQLDARANVRALVRLRVPATRILAAVTESLPAFVALAELRTAWEPDQPPAQRSTKGAAAASAGGSRPAASELELLRQELVQNRLTVSLVGTAPDDVAIAAFLTALGRSSVFEEVRLVYAVEEHERGYSRRRFDIKLRVRRPQPAAVASTAVH